MPNTTNFNFPTPADTDLVKDGAAAIRSLGNSIDTAFVDLKGGTTGQVLSKASNTDLDFTWASGGDITAVTAGIGISGGGTSGDVTITNAMADAITTKGDLLAGTGADAFARLGVGANDTVLTADSSTATGLKWASPSSADNFTLLNSGNTSLSGTGTKTITGISGKNIIHLQIDFASSANASSEIQIRFNSDTGSNYGYQGGSTYFTSTYSSSDTFGAVSSEAASSIFLGLMGNNATNIFGGGLTMFGCNATGIKVGSFFGYGSGTNSRNRYGACRYSGSSAITSVSIISSSGNFDDGSVYIWGA